MQIKNKQLRLLMEASTDFDDDGHPTPITQDDLDDSVYNPANDAYLGMTQHLQNRMTVCAKQLRPSHLAIAKLADKGLKNREIAERVRVHPNTVSSVLRQPVVRELRELMGKYAALIAGSTQAMRDSMLYRIAVRNELSDPKVAISAIAEMNKTEYNEKVHKMNLKNGGTSQQTVIVQLGDARLRPTALDDAPRHLIRDIN